MTNQAQQIDSLKEGPDASDAHTPGSDARGHDRLAVAFVGNIAHITFPAKKADGVAVRELYELTAKLTDKLHMRVVIDFTGTPYIPSGMMGMLVTVKKKIAAAGGQLHVVVTDPMSHGAFTAMRLDRILTLFTSLPDALAKFKP